MKRTDVSIAAIATLFSVLLILSWPKGAPSSPLPQLEIWGVIPGDEVLIDQQSATVRGGSDPRIFRGDPTSASAPVLKELTIGRHEISIRSADCPAKTFSIEMSGSLKHSLVFNREQSEFCKIAPLRAPLKALEK